MDCFEGLAKEFRIIAQSLVSFSMAIIIIIIARLVNDLSFFNRVPFSLSRLYIQFAASNPMISYLLQTQTDGLLNGTLNVVYVFSMSSK